MRELSMPVFEVEYDIFVQPVDYHYDLGQQQGNTKTYSDLYTENWNWRGNKTAEKRVLFELTAKLLILLARVYQ